MRNIGETRARCAANAWGVVQNFNEQSFEVEACDVGKTFSNYLGSGRPGVTITREDVGRVRVVQTDGTGWTCWYWHSGR